MTQAGQMMGRGRTQVRCAALEISRYGLAQCVVHFVAMKALVQLFGCFACTHSSHDGAGINSTQMKYGQSYLCVSLNSANLDAVALRLRSLRLVIYAFDWDTLATL